jgi:flagellar motility protein MotE (MotC chaperone)
MADEELEQTGIDDAEQAPQVDTKEKIITKKFLLIAIVPMWSFFIFFFLIYSFFIKDYKKQWLDMADNYRKKQSVKKTIPFPDSLVSQVPAAVTVGSAEWDSLFFNDLLTSDDKLRILNIENSRRQSEIDFLYEQSVEQQEYIKQLEETLSALSPESFVSTLLEQFPHLAVVPVEQEIVEEPVVVEEPKPVNPYSDEAIKSSAKIYESMKPAVAAQILSNIDENVAAAILTNTSQRKAAKILENMDRTKATNISQQMIVKG